MERHEGGNPSKPALIADPFGENFGLAEVVEDSRELSEGSERTAKVQPEIDTLLDGLATLGEMREGSERLFEPRDRFPVGRACGSLRPGLTAVGDGLVPYLSLEGMVGEAIDLLGQPVGVQLFDRLHDPSVEGPPSVLEDARVADLVAQGVLERTLQLGYESRLVQQLASLEPNGTIPERLFGQDSDCSESGEQHVLADGRRRLQNGLVLSGKPADARCEHRLDGGRHADLPRRPRSAIRPPIPG